MSTLETLHERYRLSDKKFLQILQFIIEENTLGRTSSDHPVVVILGAQPGAGKTELEKEASSTLSDNVVICNADLFRDFHPATMSIKRDHEQHYPEITARYARDWNNGLRDYCEANRLNFILETTFSSGTVMTETIAALKRKGYRVDIKLLAVHPAISLLGSHLRFEEMKAAEGSGRSVGKQAHDQRFAMIAQTLHLVQKASAYDNLQIYARNINEDHRTLAKGIYLIGDNPKDPLWVFQEEVQKEWNVNFKAFVLRNIERVIQLMLERNASQKEIDAFVNSIRFDYVLDVELNRQQSVVDTLEISENFIRPEDDDIREQNRGLRR